MVSSVTIRKQAKERTMTAMNVFNLIAASLVVGGLVAVCRAAHLLARHKHEELAAVENGAPLELQERRAA